jgi:DNA mismatch repair protein MutS
MFASSVEALPVATHPVIAELENIQADDLTPKQALDLLYQLKALLK